jgi:hypothetical protein
MRASIVAAVVLTAACGQTLVIDHRGDPGIPSPRADASSAYDGAKGTIVMFGGADRSGVLSDTWTWDGDGWRKQHPAASPPAREFAFMGFDPATGRVALFGGLTCSAPGRDDPIGCDYQKNATVLADTWTWNGSSWSELKTRHAPPVVRFRDGNGGAAADLSHGRLMLVTSSAPDPDFLAQTWVLDKGDWQRLYPKHSPLAMLLTGPAYDAVSGRLIVQQSRGPHVDYGPGGGPRPPTLTHDTTWSWDGSDWHDLGPSLRTPHSYGRLLAAGQNGLVLIWANYPMRWTGSSWSVMPQIPEEISPAMRPREAWSAAYHEPTHRLVLLGGRGGAGGNHLFADTAAWDGVHWTTLVPAPASPSGVLALCSPSKASAGSGMQFDNNAILMRQNFFEPPTGPCHLTVDVILTLTDAKGSLLPIAGNPSTQRVDADLTWKAGGQAVTFTVTGLCEWYVPGPAPPDFGRDLTASIRAGDLQQRVPIPRRDCVSSPPPPTISSSVRPSGLRP